MFIQTYKMNYVPVIHPICLIQSIYLAKHALVSFHKFKKSQVIIGNTLCKMLTKYFKVSQQKTGANLRYSVLIPLPSNIWIFLQYLQWKTMNYFIEVQGHFQEGCICCHLGWLRSVKKISKWKFFLFLITLLTFWKI